MRPRIDAQSTASGTLRAYIESNLGFMRATRNHVAATVDIALNARAADGSRLFDTSILETGQAVLQRLLAHFQDIGEFRADFDPAVMALAIRAAIDAVGTRLAHDPALDVGHHAREMADLFQVATQPEGGRRDDETVL